MVLLMTVGENVYCIQSAGRLNANWMCMSVSVCGIG